MTKGEYNKWLRQQLEDKKDALYSHVNAIIDYADQSRENLIVKSNVIALDELVQKFYDDIVPSIQKISGLTNDAWYTITRMVSALEMQIRDTIQEDRRLSDYYASEKFQKIKQTCENITKSQKDFNEYIDEKARSITSLFSSRVIREETQINDTYNYIRPYKKTISPFTAEVSNAVFSSAENNPIEYIIKYFYPNRSQYEIQIANLRLLMGELETLREAKEIIEKYKEDYYQYIQDVPDYVLEKDEDGWRKTLWFYNKYTNVS